MKKIRVLIVLEATEGGAARHVVDLASLLDKERFEISLIISILRNSFFHSTIKELRKKGVIVTEISMRRNISPLADLCSLIKIWKYTRYKKHDIIHAHSSKAGVLARIAAIFNRTPVIIYTPHCCYFIGMTGIKRYIFRLIENCLGFFTDKIVTVSRSEYELIANENIVPLGKVTVIENSILPGEARTASSPERTKESLGIHTGSKVITSISRLTRQKDIPTLLRAIKEILKKRDDVVLVIAGDGDLKNSIHRLVKQMKLEKQVILLGQVNDIRAIYSIADVVVNTSLWEGLSYAIMEALSFKLPVIATSIPANKELISDNETGLLFTKGDHLALAERIGYLLNNPVKCRTLGENGYKHITTRYGMNTFIGSHERLYASLLHKAKDLGKAQMIYNTIDNGS